ncbi:START-like domain-containing protein [Artemisia annua]|uniref:START-like domain-containing protein n=1 Tax=Artemisia annua TaxID=35608 RepID=A0A2U1NA75_ARTAN|nr:START-like domain-containing protein [Artemisia annua]
MASVTIIVPLQFKSNSNLSITTSTPHFIITTSSSTTFKKHLHFRSKKLLVTSSPQFTKSLVTSSSKNDLVQSLDDSEGEGDVNGDGEVEIEGVEVEIEKVSRNRRRIRSKVAIEASLETVWGILTDYERLAEYIPGLVVSQVLDKQTNFARLLQIGQQNLAFGLKFNAKGVVECFEKDFEVLPYGQRRDIDFKMIEGDFDLFEGTWSIEQSTDDTLEQSQRYRTTLSYTVDVVPKIWLPVQLVEGRLFKEIKTNLFSIREVAQKLSDTISSG